MSKENESTKEPDDCDEAKANFETAISKTGFGKFNILIIMAIIPTAMAPMAGNTMMSYIIPEIQCDLELSVRQKALLNSSIFIGFVISAYFWGFISDTFGRRNIILFACALDFLFNLIAAIFHNFWVLFFCKLLSGLMLSGPYAIIVAYASEMHGFIYRSKMVLFVGLSLSFTLIIMPILAWIILPIKDIFIAEIVIYSWQIYIIASAVPSLLAAFLFLFLPESPKFLMSVGENEKALNVFRRIYSCNTGNPQDSFPVKELKDESVQNSPAQSKSIKQNIIKGLHQTKPLYQRPFIWRILLCICIGFGILCGSNSFRLWLPQFLTTMDELNQINQRTNVSVCEAINYSFSTKKDNSSNVTQLICEVVEGNDLVYIDSIIVSVFTTLGYILLITVINYLNKKIILALLLILGGIFTISIYWSPNSLSTLCMFTINVEFTGIPLGILYSLIVELFPTSLRAMALSLTIMAGQGGSLFINLIFPSLAEYGCLPPFAFVGGLVVVTGLLCLLLPNPSGKNLQ